MHLHEYQAKKLFAKYGLPLPIGYICNTPKELETAASEIGSGPWILKCQVHAGGRGKAGGIKLVTSKKDILMFAQNWLGKRLITYQTDTYGQPVNQILIESATEIKKELYLGGVVDRDAQRVVFMASTAGGINIEKMVEGHQHSIHKIVLDPLTGPQPYQGRELAFKLGLIGNQILQFTKIFLGLADLFLERDLELVEINPLVITSQGHLICLDAKLTIDDNALFHQMELREMYDPTQEDSRESYAMNWKLNYVALTGGNIGCMVNGAGLAMGTMDLVKSHGGHPANFLDIGGSATIERITEAFKIILSDKTVQAIFINIFGGIVRCDLVADGILSATTELDIHLPIVVRLEGNNAEMGIIKLKNTTLNIIGETNLSNAVKKVIAIARRINNVNSD